MRTCDLCKRGARNASHHHQLRTSRQGVQPRPFAVRTPPGLPPLRARATHGAGDRQVYRTESAAEHGCGGLLVAARPHARDGERDSARTQQGAGRARAGGTRSAHRRADHRSGQRIPRHAHRAWRGRTVEAAESQARAQSVDAKLGRELPLDRRSRAGFRTRKGARIPG